MRSNTFLKILLAILRKIVYTNLAPAGVMGSKATAAGGGVRELSEWQRSIADVAAPPARKISGTVTGMRLCAIIDILFTPAGVMELVDVVDSKSTAGDSVPVRVRSPAPNIGIPASGIPIFLCRSDENRR